METAYPGPLTKLEASSVQQPLILVIDALDECEGENDIQGILRLFIEAQCLKNVRIQLLITSRPEIPIRFGFSTMPIMMTGV